MIVSAAKLSVRRMVRYPATTVLTVATLVIGFGVSATIAAVAWSILVRPFPFANEQRLVALPATRAASVDPAEALRAE